MTEGTIGARLKRALKDADMSQSDLVDATGLDKNTISAIVNGKSRPRLATITKIERAIGLTPGTLEGLGEEEEEQSPLPATTAADLTDEQLLAELGYRLTRLQRENASLTQQLQSPPADTGKTPPAPVSALDARRARFLAQAMPVTEAAYEGENHEGDNE